MLARKLWSFPAEYSAVEVGLPPGAPKDMPYYFPSGSRRGGQDGIAVSVTPSGGGAWLGIFAFGAPSGDSPSLLASAPHPREVVVVSRGLAIRVRADNPGLWSEVPAFPVREVLVAPENGLLLLADFTKVAAIGARGVAWVTERLSMDGVRLLEVRGGHLIGQADDPTGGSPAEFSVDLRSGSHQGGTGRRY